MLWSASKQSHLVCGRAAMLVERPLDIARWYPSRIRWRV
jgi:hypothetical protein